MLYSSPIWQDGADARDNVFANLPIGRAVQPAAAVFTRSNGAAGANGESNGLKASLHPLIYTCFRTFTMVNGFVAMKHNANRARIPRAGIIELVGFLVHAG
jgi:hypothetical protein